jgi:hypothetical protein
MEEVQVTIWFGIDEEVELTPDTAKEAFAKAKQLLLHSNRLVWRNREPWKAMGTT